jgi:hypothetical protein
MRALYFPGEFEERAVSHIKNVDRLSREDRALLDLIFGKKKIPACPPRQISRKAKD